MLINLHTARPYAKAVWLNVSKDFQVSTSKKDPPWAHGQPGPRHDGDVRFFDSPNDEPSRVESRKGTVARLTVAETPAVRTAIYYQAYESMVMLNKTGSFKPLGRTF